ncbi:GNAT family N-acetyltransferase [Nibricoccus aquaticus]|uniref:GNAT family N-acetyltransferase n=1 Tax=Nibricoccus aquaticus TaxID=2576891 RepID=A0A290Q3A7_9BACT|nr:GNAT family N-acetyltransferase [Nibricoccus aquaticus]ATC63155.1 GNAT family N-acetyltransferase [Nibricoccus aquaticus]
MTIAHEPAASRFIARLPEGDSVVEYSLTGDAVVFTHTLVPAALRGRGIAEALVRAALAWASGENLHVGATCSYVARFIERHPELARR